MDRHARTSSLSPTRAPGSPPLAFTGPPARAATAGVSGAATGAGATTAASRGRPRASSTATDLASDSGAVSSSSDVPSDVPPAAYLIEWRADELSHRTALPPLTDGVGTATGSGNANTNTNTANPSVEAIRHAWHIKQDASLSSVLSGGGASTHAFPQRRLFVVRNTGHDDTNHTMCAALGVDPAFVTAHSARLRYQPVDRPWRGRNSAEANAAATASFYTYPEVLTIIRSEDASKEKDKVKDKDNTKKNNTNESPVIGVEVRRHTMPPMEADEQEGGNEARLARIMSIPGEGDGNGGGNGNGNGNGHGNGANTPRRQPSHSRARSAQSAPSRTHSRSRSRSKSPMPSPEEGQDVVAVFCRASLWTGPYANVLLLDRSPSSTALEDALCDALDDAAECVSAARAEDGTTEAAAAGAAGAAPGTPPTGATTAPLAPMALPEILYNVVSGLAYEQWLDFFDALHSNSRGTPRANKRLYWDMGQFLEQNLFVARMREKRQLLQKQTTTTGGLFRFQVTYLPPDLQSASPDDWKALAARLERTVALLPLRQKNRDSNGNGNGPKRRKMISLAADSSQLSDMFASPMRVDGAGGGGDQKTETGGGDGDGGHESAAALDRVTYMGGILLPFTIVASVLSMNDEYSPGANKFWVFWAFAVPLTLLSIFVIYADSLRKAEVWVEVASDGIQAAVAQAAAFAKSSAVGVDSATAEAEAEAEAAEGLLSDIDSEIETDKVSSAVRRGGYRSNRKAARVHVATEPNAGGRTLYRLSEPDKKYQQQRRRPRMAAAAAAVVAAQRPLSSVSGVTTEGGGKNDVDQHVQPAEGRWYDHITFQRPQPQEQQTTSYGPGLRPHRAQHGGGGGVGGGVGLGLGVPHIPDDVAIDMGEEDFVTTATTTGSQAPLTEGTQGTQGIQHRPTYYSSGRTPSYILKPTDSRTPKPKAWRRKQLGWAGAAKTIVGYKKPRWAHDMPVGLPAVERRKTRTL